MDFVKLSDEQRRQFNEDGFFIVKQALDQATIDTLIAAGDRVVATDLMENRYRTKNGVYDGFRNCIVLDDAFIELLMHPKTVPLVPQLLGPNIQMMTTHLIYKHPDPAGTPPTAREPGWHRDVAGTTEDLGYAHTPRMELKIAYYLTDLSQPNWGSTLFSPGSNHLKERLDIPAGRADPLNVVEPLLEPGDAVFFENRTWHAATANLSNHTRKAVMFGYGYRWLKPMDYVVQPQELIDKLDPIGQQLVGGLHSPDGTFIPGGLDWPIREWCKDYGVTHEPAK